MGKQLLYSHVTQKIRWVRACTNCLWRYRSCSYQKRWSSRTRNNSSILFCTLMLMFVLWLAGQHVSTEGHNWDRRGRSHVWMTACLWWPSNKTPAEWVRQVSSGLHIELGKTTLNAFLAAGACTLSDWGRDGSLQTKCAICNTINASNKYKTNMRVRVSNCQVRLFFHLSAFTTRHYNVTR